MPKYPGLPLARLVVLAGCFSSVLQAASSHASYQCLCCIDLYGSDR